MVPACRAWDPSLTSCVARSLQFHGYVSITGLILSNETRRFYQEMHGCLGAYGSVSSVAAPQVDVRSFDIDPAKEHACLHGSRDLRDRIRDRVSHIIRDLGGDMDGFEHLQHVNVHRSNASLRTPLLRHTDAGGLLAFVPASVQRSPSQEWQHDAASFSSDGDRGYRSRQLHADSLTLVVGEQWNAFGTNLNLTALSHSPSVAPHATRIWYGAMFTGRATGQGCHTTHRRQAQTSTQCAANTLLCWHQCMDVSQLQRCASEAQCVDLETGVPWNSQHDCTSCAPVCTASSPPNGTTDAFCFGVGTSMLMQGFELHPTSCIIFLFRALTLHTTLAFAAAVVVTACLGVLAEFLTHVRRHWLSQSPRLLQRPWAYKCAMSLAFSCQLCIGYALMLIAMTYRVELFLAVMVGLTCGHVMFNMHGPVEESIDACCVEGPVSAKHLRVDISPIVCSGCVRECKSVLEQLPQVQRVEVNASGEASVWGSCSLQVVTQSMHAIGKNCSLPTHHIDTKLDANA